MMATCVAWRLEDRRGNVFDLKSRGNAEGRLFQTQAVGVPCVKGPLDECKLTSPDCGSPRSPTATPRSRTTPCRSPSPYPTPPPAPRRAPPTPLHKALIVGCPFQVRQVLEEDPAAADMPFMDHDFEPPICACVRLDCSVEILKLLLAHGASVNVRDVDGHTALSLLSSNSCRFRPLKGDFFDPQVKPRPSDWRHVPVFSQPIRIRARALRGKSRTTELGGPNSAGSEDGIQGPDPPGCRMSA
ncbi:unnamed protein product [Durusdinium trenchii]|uniref:Uncharacterized protein n=1 Tax=Durusdinium trenchii TaxID=1381693 RepID=A0ABP0KW09_9DINO